jgi:hypothetical protein
MTADDLPHQVLKRHEENLRLMTADGR